MKAAGSDPVALAASEKSAASGAALAPRLVSIADLSPHPRNYRKHPAEQIQQIIASIRQFGFYRNVVATKQGNFILAGHGVVQAARQDGHTQVPVILLDLDPFSAAALKILAGDNELSNLAQDDERMLAEILKDVMKDESLAGTGYNEDQLVNLIFTSTSRAEFASPDDARLWAGLPVYERQDNPIRLIVTFPTMEDRESFVGDHKISIRKKEERCWSAHWPNRPRAHPGDLLFEEVQPAAAKP